MGLRGMFSHISGDETFSPTSFELAQALILL